MGHYSIEKERLVETLSNQVIEGLRVKLRETSFTDVKTVNKLKRIVEDAALKYVLANMDHEAIKDFAAKYCSGDISITSCESVVRYLVYIMLQNYINIGSIEVK